MDKAPLSDAIAVAISKMVDDAGCDKYREPSHSDIEFEFKRVGLLRVDPKQQGKTVGKAKRVKAVLTWAIDNDIEAGEKLVYLLLSLVRSVGGFRLQSSNYSRDKGTGVLSHYKKRKSPYGKSIRITQLL